MGEYAQLEIDNQIGSWGENYDDEYNDGYIPMSAYLWTTVHIIEVQSESDKAWKILVGAEGKPWKAPLWFPKSRCKLNRKEKSLSVPDWLWSEKLKEYAAKKRELAQGQTP